VCTASWLIRPDGFELFFNRDESLRRGRALGPERLELEGARVLAPRDADAGGTWIGVNEHGLALGLLNGASARPAPSAPTSRGLLVRALLSAPDVDEALARLARADLDRYRGFTLALFAPGRAPVLQSFDGVALRSEEAGRFVASSSLDGGRARRERARVLDELLADEAPTRELLTRFQQSHAPERGPWSPCMHRADAATVSATEVRVGATHVALRYADGPPCTSAFGPWLELERRGCA
jgi:uncharacterized protein with NRDE domain